MNCVTVRRINSADGKYLRKKVRPGSRFYAGFGFKTAYRKMVLLAMTGVALKKTSTPPPASTALLFEMTLFEMIESPP